MARTSVSSDGVSSSGSIKRRPSNSTPHEREVDQIMAGRSLVKSYDGTSQYAQKSVSSCGLASFNAIKTVLELEATGGATGTDLVFQMLSRELMDHIIGICSLWRSTTHLEVDDILNFSYFSRALQTVHTAYKVANYEQFTELLQRLSSITGPGRSSAAVITKPPEIMAVFAIATNQPAPRPSVIFAVFDSHSRPVHHPDGAAFSFFGNASDAAAYLSSLLSVDPEVLKDPRMQWQAQLLSQFSAHSFVIGGTPKTMKQMELELFESNVALLDTRSVLTEMKETVSDLQSKYAGAMRANAHLKDELMALRLKLQLSKEGSGAGSDAGQASAPMEIEVEVKAVGTERKGKGKAKVEPDADDVPTPPSQDGFISWTDSKLSLPFSINPLDYFSGKSRSTTNSKSEASGSHGAGYTTYASVAAEGSRAKRRAADEDRASNDHMVAAKLHISEEEEERRKEQQIRQNQMIADAHLAAKLQREIEREEEDQRMMEGLQQKTFQCGICFEKSPEDDLAVPEGCAHQFCRDCLTAHTQATLDDMKYPILCPVCMTDKDVKKEDGGVISGWIVEALGLPEEQYQKLVQLELATVSVQLQCPKCKNTVLVDRGDHQEAQIFGCPMGNCDNLWCKMCMQTVTSHSAADHSCDGTKELDRLMGKTGWKRCPGCQTLIEKTAGCDHMTCRAPGCNTHFSYTTGGRMN